MANIWFVVCCLCLVLCGANAAGVAAMNCSDKCTVAGHCCQGTGSACQKPSCAMGCIAAEYTSSESACNDTCVAAGGAHPGSSGCQYNLPNSNISFKMCGVCRTEPAPAWWPSSAKPPNGSPPKYWPPGYSLPDCSSCGNVDNDPVGECKLGCIFAFRPDIQPVPPKPPTPPAPRPDPPLCGVFPSGRVGDLNPWSTCVVGASVNFSTVFGSHMVLEMSGATVYGYVGTNATGQPRVKVHLSSPDHHIQVAATTSKGGWSAVLPAMSAGGRYSVRVVCEGGCEGEATIQDVTFGSVWYCFGQSNMALPLQFTYARNQTIAQVKQGVLDGLRIHGLKGNMNADQQWIKVADAVGVEEEGFVPPYGSIPLDHFSSTCLYFGAALIEGLRDPPPIGLVHTAWGGSMIEQWIDAEGIHKCHGANIAPHNHNLFDANVKPYSDMRLSGWVYYQGENNCGGLHGNSGTSSQPPSGYACMMANLVDRFRSVWRQDLPFGIVSLSAHDSEGAKDMASFRWAQQGSYGSVPNAIMPNTFMAHAFDLQDPWNGNTGACDTHDPLPGYDCRTPWFMGPGIHPRLKRPVGQRLALGAMKAAYDQGEGVFGGSLKGCSLTDTTLTLLLTMGSRTLRIRDYNRSNIALSATSVLIGTQWTPVHIALGTQPDTVVVDLPSFADGGAISAIRYAWGAVGEGDAVPNGDDVSCCEGDGVEQPCVPVQCPLLAAEPLAPFGSLPVDPFLALIVGDKCVCPEPQVCSA